jgi:hypothetical protein
MAIGGFQVGPFQLAYQQAAGAASGAGRASKSSSRRNRYFVEIDGETFEVSGPDHARALLDRAAEMAQQVAAEVATQVVPQRRKSAASTKPVALPTPRISSPNPELANEIRQARIAINEIYRKAAINAELALLMALQRQREQDDDDDETIFLLM